LVTVAHPDDESFGCATSIAWLVDRGFRVVVACATRGEAGEDATGLGRSGDELGALREGELHAAGDRLGVGSVELLGLADSGWDGPHPDRALVGSHAATVEAVAMRLRRDRPVLVVTMDPTGSDGHRDHAAIGRATTEAFESVVDWDASLYHWCLPRSLMARWTAVESGRDPASVYLEIEMGRADDEITTVIDGRALRPRVEAAISCHGTQRSPYDGLSQDLRDAFVDADHLVRVHPPWTGGPTESSLWPFEA
jgi:LmbE family N-acetylglucosaminyl deacetylase